LTSSGPASIAFLILSYRWPPLQNDEQCEQRRQDQPADHDRREPAPNVAADARWHRCGRAATRRAYAGDWREFAGVGRVPGRDNNAGGAGDGRRLSRLDGEVESAGQEDWPTRDRAA